MQEDFEDLHEINESEEYTRNYDVRYIAEIRHLGLGTYRVLKDKDNWILDNKVEAQFLKWDEQWSKIVHKTKVQQAKESSQNLADERTTEAKQKIKQVENILVHTLGIDDAIEWDTLKDTRKFKIANPKNNLDEELSKVPTPQIPSYKTLPIEPNRFYYHPQFSFIDKLIKSKKESKIKQSEQAFNEAMDLWRQSVAAVHTHNHILTEKYEYAQKEVEREKEKLRKKYELLELEWKQERQQYLAKQQEHNDKIDGLRKLYFSRDTNAVIQYCELVLNKSEYPDSFPKDFDLHYNSENKLLIVEYILPSLEDLPKLSEVKYVAIKKELRESYLSDSQVAKLFDNTIYSICLRTIHELFEADKSDAIDAIVFNGWIESISKATGKKANSCIASVQTKKADFIQIDLANVDPKTCFKSLKGISSSKLSTITAIAPIVQINRNDKRFVSSYDVAHTLDEGYNLAIMDWEDFEHLIRELFEKEFSTNGGEVKVTQASRDGGVDAVAFDPDPIRGGKIVIQAKRYTNTVGVSAVRDLYGTVMNEGATKGILVSTADYGSDAYEFIKNKPLTLLNGGNLLSLLEKHGHKARIDLAEAKKVLRKD